VNTVVVARRSVGASGSTSRRRFAAVSVAAVLGSSSAVLADTVPPAAGTSAVPDGGTGYRSAFADYVPYVGDAPARAWRAANDAARPGHAAPSAPESASHGSHAPTASAPAAGAPR
jgi:hypothetical protein